MYTCAESPQHVLCLFPGARALGTESCIRRKTVQGKPCHSICHGSLIPAGSKLVLASFLSPHWTQNLPCFIAQQVHCITYLCYWISMDHRIEREGEGEECEGQRTTGKRVSTSAVTPCDHTAEAPMRNGYNWVWKTPVRLSNGQV